MIGPLGRDRMGGVMIVERASEADVFQPSLPPLPVRKRRSGGIVVLENAGPRRVPNACRLSGEAKASRLSWPPCSPGLNRIELCWSKLSSRRKDLGARTQRVSGRAIGRAMDLIGCEGAVARFTHCDYGTQAGDRRQERPGRGRNTPPGNRIDQKYFADRALRAPACLM